MADLPLEETRRFAEELDAWAGAGMKEPVKWQPVYRRAADLLRLLLSEVTAQRERAEALEKERNAEQRDRNFWAANASRERRRLEEEITRLKKFEDAAMQAGVNNKRSDQ